MSNSTGREPGFNTKEGVKGFQTAVPVAPPAPTANPLAGIIGTETVSINANTVEEANEKILSLYDKVKDQLAPIVTEENTDLVNSFDIEYPESYNTEDEVVPAHRDRQTFQKYSSFKSEILALTDALFKARPSTLTQEARAEVYQKWVNDASVVYGLSGAPEIVWGTTGDASYNQEANVLQLNSEKPYINKLLKGFRLTQLALGNATTLPSLTEREYTREEYTYDGCECGDLDPVSESSDICSDCLTFIEERINEYRLPGNVRNRNYQKDAKAWSESLYYKSRPVLFKKKAQEGGFGRHARSYFSTLATDDVELSD